jgi:UDP-N-acetylmuramyl tripeptide synthase
VFGAGGDQTGKRPQIGRVTVEQADLPSLPMTIRAAKILPVADSPARRVRARLAIVARPLPLPPTGKDDSVLVAGKGHEQGRHRARCGMPRPAIR